MDFYAVTVDLFSRDGGPESPCRWTSQSEIYTYTILCVCGTKPQAQDITGYQRALLRYATQKLMAFLKITLFL